MPAASSSSKPGRRRLLDKREQLATVRTMLAERESELAALGGGQTFEGLSCRQIWQARIRARRACCERWQVLALVEQAATSGFCLEDDCAGMPASREWNFCLAERVALSQMSAAPAGSNSVVPAWPERETVSGRPPSTYWYSQTPGAIETIPGAGPCYLPRQMEAVSMAESKTERKRTPNLF